MLSRICLRRIESFYSRVNGQSPRSSKAKVFSNLPSRLLQLRKSLHTTEFGTRKVSMTSNCEESNAANCQLPPKPLIRMALSDATVEFCNCSISTPTLQCYKQQEAADQARSRIEDMISSLPLVRYLRSVATKSSSQALNQYKETRPYQTMHSAARSTHLVVNSFLCPEKLAVDPHFFISTHQHHRVIATCYVGPQLCGHAGYVHGGVPFLLFDDLFARCASTLFDSGVAMTANMNIDFRKPAIPDRVYLYRAETVMTEGRKAWLTGQMRCMNPFTADEMLNRRAAVSDEVSEEEENEGILVAEATALFVEPKFEKTMVALFPE